MRRFCLVAVALGLALSSPVVAQSGPRSFTFVGWGDVPYRIPDDYAKVDRLIAAINAVKPALSVHVGDVKAGNTPCSDEIFQRSLEQIQKAEQPVVYSIGDNDGPFVTARTTAPSIRERA
jgi:hypothetical protein